MISFEKSKLNLIANDKVNYYKPDSDVIPVIASGPNSLKLKSKVINSGHMLRRTAFVIYSTSLFIFFKIKK